MTSWNRKQGRRRHPKGGAAPYVDALFAEALESASRRSSSSSKRRPGRGTEKHLRHARALCRQAQRAIGLALAGECNDDVLRDALVESVEPAPNASRLVVRVAMPAHASAVPLSELLERLERVRGVLRRAVAQAVTRKRAPELVFVPVPTPSAPQQPPPAGEVRP